MRYFLCQGLGHKEDQLRIISLQQGGDVKGVFERLSRGIKTIGDSVKAESNKEFMLDPKYGYLHIKWVDISLTKV